MGTDNLRNWYLLLDSAGMPLARGQLISPPDAPNPQIQVSEDKIAAVLDHEDLQLVSMDESTPNLLGRIIRHRKNIIVLEKLKALGVEIRQNLRMPVQFDSYIYPLTGSWKGRRAVISRDFSCGGVAFFSQQLLEDGEQLEIVIPITSEPLITKCEVLRQRPSGRDAPLYAAKFVDLCDDEEKMLREAVFNVQLSTRA